MTAFKYLNILLFINLVVEIYIRLLVYILISKYFSGLPLIFINSLDFIP